MVNLLLRRTKYFFLYLLLSASKLPGAAAGILPANGSNINSTHVMFEFEDIYGAEYYTLDIYLKKNLETPGKGSPVFSSRSINLSILVKKGLQFGNTYLWQFRAYKKEKPVYSSPWYNFTILSSPVTDSTFFRQEVTTYGKPGDDLLLIDHAAMAIDRSGKPVWFLPVETDSLDKLVTRDVNLSPAGTITYLDKNGAYEKKIDGTLLWKGPDDGRISGGTKEEYHHQLLKLGDGSFIVCGAIYKPGKQVSTKDAPRFNTIIHYNKDGTIRWSWNELSSIEKDPLFKQYKNNQAGGHLNGFAFTTDNSRMLLSFKNLSDVYVLNCSTGLFETSIRQNLSTGNFNFSQQHGPFYSPSGEVFIYNNNITEGNANEEEKEVHPSVMIFKYSPAGKKFSCLANHEIRASKYPEGIAGKEGYASETKKGNVLVCTGGADYAVEFNRNWQKTWECYFYKRTKEDTTWKPYSNYRCRSIASLYPLFYTLQYVRTVNNQYTFRLHNSGSDAAKYELEFFTKDSAKKIVYTSSLLAPGASQSFSVPAGWAKEKNFSCTISLLADKDQAKTYHYDFITPQTALPVNTKVSSLSVSSNQ